MKYVLSLGSNKGDRYQFIRSGVRFLSGLGTILSKSSVFETSPVGMGVQTGSFLNSVIVLDSDLEPVVMLIQIKEFEHNAGRNLKHSHLQPREIDIDILFAGDLMINTSILTIPHREIMNRKFILEPLNEIIPDYKHPVSGISIRELLNKLVSDEKVSLYKLKETKNI